MISPVRLLRLLVLRTLLLPPPSLTLELSLVLYPSSLMLNLGPALVVVARSAALSVVTWSVHRAMAMLEPRARALLLGI